MESAELTKLVFSRVQKLDPENVFKIVGCVLLRGPNEDEMVQLAYGPDTALISSVVDAKATLAALTMRPSSPHYAGSGGRYQQQFSPHPAGVRHFSPSFSFHLQSSDWPEKTQECAFLNGAAENHYQLRGDHGLMDDHIASMGRFYYTSAGAAEGAFPKALGRRYNGGIPSRRPCHYFFKGVCKNGQNCHYSHQQVYSDGGFVRAVDHPQGGTTPGSLERLELEISELLYSRGGQPVSIASLPTLYGEKYGKGLQADGYLTESQRHGKAGYSLTKLLTRLNKINVIERPHGQHAVVLAEDAYKYTECRSHRGGDMPASSHQIYLTFPSESTFTEDDVAIYFGQFGPVRNVRIPCQDERMFGFVSFQNPETVTALLTGRHPHFICGSLVLAKPYREKSKSAYDRSRPAMMMQCFPPPRWRETDAEIYPGVNVVPPEYGSPRPPRRQLADRREKQYELEVERRRLAGLRVEPLPPRFTYFDCSIGDVSPLNSQSPGSEELGLVDPLDTPGALDIVSTSQASEERAGNNSHDDQESCQIIFPENPFICNC